MPSTNTIYTIGEKVDNAIESRITAPFNTITAISRDVYGMDYKEKLKDFIEGGTARTMVGSFRISQIRPAFVTYHSDRMEFTWVSRKYFVAHTPDKMFQFLREFNNHLKTIEECWLEIDFSFLYDPSPASIILNKTDIVSKSVHFNRANFDGSQDFDIFNSTPYEDYTTLSHRYRADFIES